VEGREEMQGRGDQEIMSSLSSLWISESRRKREEDAKEDVRRQLWEFGVKYAKDEPKGERKEKRMAKEWRWREAKEEAKEEAKDTKQ